MPEYILSPRAEETCLRCPLAGSRYVKQQVTTEVHSRQQISDGTMGVDVMFIAEAPGKVENQRGRPVIGGTGLILRQLVTKLNGSEEGVAYGNIVRCRPANEEDPRKDRPPTQRESSACKSNILNDIMRIRPKRIVLLGKSAAAGLALHADSLKPVSPDTSIFKLRGKDYVIQTPDGSRFPTTITYHFAFIARSPTHAGVFEEDINKMFLRARGALRDYSQRGHPVEMVTEVDRLESLLHHMVTGLGPDQVIGMDYETVSTSRIGNDMLTVGFAFDPNKAYVVPYQHPESPWSGVEFQQVKKLLTKFFSTRDVSFRSMVCHNLKFECAITLDTFGVSLWNLPLEDTMLRAHALNENRKAAIGGAFGLKALSDEWLGFQGYYADDIAPVVAMRNKGALRDAPIGPLCEYNGMDCYVTWRLHHYQECLAQQDGYADTLRRLGLTLHGPVSMFAAHMERNGIRADKEQLRGLMRRDSPIVGRQADIEGELHSMDSVKTANQVMLRSNVRTRGMRGIWGGAQKDPWLFHINKPDAKKALFMDTLHLSAKTTAKGKPSFDKGFYGENKEVREVQLISEWTALDKLRGTYVDSIFKMLQTNPDMRDGRVRANFNFHTTATSRTSSDRPNMQNIPKGKTPTALAVKSVYAVDPGNLMICADYSQAEVRWLAQITGDPFLKKAFEAVAAVQQAYIDNPTPENFERLMKEGDFHRQTAAIILQKPAQDITDMERGKAKAIVFGLIYGMSVFGLAERLKITKEEAQAFQDTFLNQFPQAREWLSYIEGAGLKQGYVESPIGRRRHLSSGFLINDDNQFFEFQDAQGGNRRTPTEIGKRKSYEDRVCRNAPIQSIASDTNLMACINIQRYIEDHNKPWRLINIVHDSIIAEVPWEDTREYVEVINRIMVDPELFKAFGVSMTIPFVADFTLGPNWGEQVDVGIDSKYGVVCNDCSKDRKETEWPQNKRCEECGSTNVTVELRKGPLDLVLRYLSHRFGYGSN
jgi:uracil-DNA glycosylase family 4